MHTHTHTHSHTLTHTHTHTHTHSAEGLLRSSTDLSRSGNGWSICENNDGARSSSGGPAELATVQDTNSNWTTNFRTINFRILLF